MKILKAFSDNKKHTLTITEIVFQHLKRAILEGEFKDGEKLSTQDIVKQLNVSRMPVREAFRKLETEELVTIHPQKGVVVSDTSIKEFKELKEMRLLLEKYALKLAIKRATEKDDAQLEKMIIMEDTEEDPRELSKMRIEFHKKLYSISNNEFLCQTISYIFDRFNRYVYLYSDLTRSHEMLNQYSHRELLDFFKERNTEKSLIAVEKHINLIYNEVMMALKK